MLESPLDLPQVWQKPTFPVLLAALQGLRVDPPVWNLKASRTEMLKPQETVTQDPREIAAYLSTIIKSPLSWLVDEEDREAIWEEASRRFSERCGRSGTFDAFPPGVVKTTKLMLMLMPSLSHGGDYQAVAL